MQVTRHRALSAALLFIGPIAAGTVGLAQGATTAAACLGTDHEGPTLTVSGILNYLQSSPQAAQLTVNGGVVCLGPSTDPPPTNAGTHSVDAPVTANAKELMDAQASINIKSTPALVDFVSDMHFSSSGCFCDYDLGTWQSNYMASNSQQYNASATDGSNDWKDTVQSCQYYQAGYQCQVGVQPQVATATTTTTTS